MVSNNCYFNRINTIVCLQDVNTKYANYLDQAKMSEDLYSNYLQSYSQQLNYSPLHILSQVMVLIVFLSYTNKINLTFKSARIKSKGRRTKYMSFNR